MGRCSVLGCKSNSERKNPDISFYTTETKTPITILQERLIKLGETPEYECIAQSGPAHSAMFEYRCRALGATSTAVARSKREAKQAAARALLDQLDSCGRCASPPDSPPPPAPRTAVLLLKELCEDYHLGAPVDEVVSDVGPSHLRHFTVRVRVGGHQRQATATTKKAARQLAAEQLYSYLREHLVRLTTDFVEEEALARGAWRARGEARGETRGEAPERRPDLGLRLADYHPGMALLDGGADEEALERGRAALAAGADAADVAQALGLRWAAAVVGGVSTLSLEDAAPALAVAGAGPRDLDAAARLLLERALRPRPPRR